MTRDFVGYAGKPPSWSLPGDARLGISVVINIEEGAEREHGADCCTRRRSEGVSAGNACPDLSESIPELNYPFPETHRDLASESVFEYGGRAGVGRLLGVCDELGVDATMFVAARALERNEPLARRLAASRHELCAHGYCWQPLWELGEEEQVREYRLAAATVQRLCGRAPLGWYSRYCPTPITRQLLRQSGLYAYDSDAYNDDFPYFPFRGDPYVVLPYSLVHNDIRLLPQHGAQSLRDFADVVYRACRRLLKESHVTQPSIMSIGLHPRVMGHPGRADMLAELLHAVARQDQVAVLRRQDIVSAFRTSFGYEPLVDSRPSPS